MGELLFATSNKGKLADAKKCFVGTEYDLIMPATLCERTPALTLPGEVEETGDTYEANAELKAAALSQWSGIETIADDSGLEVEALGGEPGLYSARFAGPGCTFDDNIRKLLSALESEENRAAKFVSVICYLIPDSSPIFFRGELEGVITHKQRGRGGFGYDPVFEVSGTGKTLAELKEGEGEVVTHRTKALQLFLRFLEAA